MQICDCTILSVKDCCFFVVLWIKVIVERTKFSKSFPLDDEAIIPPSQKKRQNRFDILDSVCLILTKINLYMSTVKNLSIFKDRVSTKTKTLYVFYKKNVFKLPRIDLWHSLLSVYLYH